MKDIAIYGFGGFGREIACLINMINDVEPTWKLIGFFDDGRPVGEQNKYGKVLGGLEAVNGWSKPLSVVMSVATPHILKKITEQITNPNIDFPNIFAPNTIFLDRQTLNIGRGNVFFLGCRVSCDVSICDFNLVNGAVSFGHDVQLGSYNVLGPSTRLSGNTIIGNENFFGVYATLLQGIRVGDRVRIGANSVVMRSAKDDMLYIGNPAKIVKI